MQTHNIHMYCTVCSALLIVLDSVHFLILFHCVIYVCMRTYTHNVHTYVHRRRGWCALYVVVHLHCWLSRDLCLLFNIAAVSPHRMCWCNSCKISLMHLSGSGLSHSNVVRQFNCRFADLVQGEAYLIQQHNSCHRVQ